MDERNVSGRPLAGTAWLETHHRAKLSARRAFCQRLAQLNPTRVVDLGCATGLWLEELNKVLPTACEFVGLDSDEAALDEAIRRAHSWSRPTTFRHGDIDAPDADVPEADLTLLFSLSPYLGRLGHLLSTLADRSGSVAVRQYDGALIRFGPMSSEDRSLIEMSLQASVAPSGQFRHYDLDRVLSAIRAAGFEHHEIGFELFERTAPFSPEVAAYLEATVDWTLKHISEVARKRLQAWWSARDGDLGIPTYVVEVELAALVS